MTFSLGLVQAISDWQRGGDAKAKRRRANRLRHVANELHSQFKQTSLTCFRQIALDKRAIWELHDKLYLSETISSWTLDIEVAKEFKGGVPPAGYQGIILDIVPTGGSVIVNLSALFRDAAFQAACKRLRSQVVGFADGLGRYGGSQQEVVFDVPFVPMNSVYALGGYSSSREILAQLLFGHRPSEDEIKQFDALLEKSGRELGPNWVSGEAKDRVLKKTLIKYGILKEQKRKS